jgi:glycosyltransferase involved in cell wall biosynthesis
VICYVGYVRASFWIARRAAKASGAAFIFGTDAHSLAPRDGKKWKASIKKLFWPFLFRQADQVIVPSSGTFEMISRLGIAENRITLTPYAVDNEWWKSESAKVDRTAVRARWKVSPEQPVILFCAKLQSWKRPMDLLRAFAQANIEGSTVLFAGEGSQRFELEAEVEKLGLQQRVRFLGFVNQSQLPELYTSADVMVLPSNYEPFAVVVNEAMCCGCPVVVSAQVGAARDLVAPVRQDFVYPAGDVEALAVILRRVFSDRDQLRETGRKALDHIDTNSPTKMIAATVDAVRKGVEIAKRAK